MKPSWSEHCISFLSQMVQGSTEATQVHVTSQVEFSALAAEAKHLGNSKALLPKFHPQGLFSGLVWPGS